MRSIKLSNDFVTWVDDDLFEEFNKHNWHVSGWGYVNRPGSSFEPTIYMHAVILGLQTGEQGDHIDGNKLNNQRINLRKVTRSQNQQNHDLQPNNTSGFKGVSYDTQRGTWAAYINKDRKRRFLGRFSTSEEAARAYDKKAVELFGENSGVNFPSMGLPGVLP